MIDIAKLLRSLPQFHRLNRDDVQKYVDHITKNQPDRLQWLLERAGKGFGGSDIGPLILDAMGKKPPFDSAASIINSKLLRTLPKYTTDAMARGTKLEKLVIDATTKLYGGTNNLADRDAFSKTTGKEPAGLAGEIDFSWDTNNNQRILVDIKVPASGDHQPGPETDFCYCAQLNTYNMLSRSKGVPPYDRLINIYLEIPTVISDAYIKRLEKGDKAEYEKVLQEMCALLKHSTPGLRLNFVEHEINPIISTPWGEQRLEDLIASTAAMNWECVLAGEIPSIEGKTNPLTPEKRLEISKVEEQLLILHASSQLIEEKKEQIHAQLYSLTAGVSEGEISITDHVKIKSTQSIDTKRLETVIARYGINPDTLREDRNLEKRSLRDYSPEKMLQELEKIPDFDRSLVLNDAPYAQEKIARALENVGEKFIDVTEKTTRISIGRTKNTLQTLVGIKEKISPSFETLLDTPAVNLSAPQISEEIDFSR